MIICTALTERKIIMKKSMKFIALMSAAVMSVAASTLCEPKRSRNRHSLRFTERKSDSKTRQGHIRKRHKGKACFG